MDNLEPWTSKTIRPGQRYGRLLVISTHRRRGTYRYFALCQCDCGSAQRYAPVLSLRNGQSASCGCLHKERVTKHGAWGTPLFNSWRAMMSRCYKSTDKRFAQYGGRGITVCDRWHDVNLFIEDMHSTFAPGLKIERQNNNGNYEKSNCAWATSAQQNRNYSRNVNLTFNGETLCLADWATKININYGTLWDRLKQGWSVERALTTPTLSNAESNRLALSARYKKTL